MELLTPPAQLIHWGTTNHLVFCECQRDNTDSRTIEEPARFRSRFRRDGWSPEEPASTIGFAAMADTANLNNVVAGADEEEPVIAGP